MNFFFAYFCNPLIKLTWKMFSNACKTFLAIQILKDPTVKCFYFERAIVFLHCFLVCIVSHYLWLKSLVRILIQGLCYRCEHPSLLKIFGFSAILRSALFFEVGSQIFRNDYKILRSQPQNSTSIILWPQWPQKRPFLTFQK